MKRDFEMPRRALITGITGQDGSYLAELLLEMGYQVHGILRRSSTFNTPRIDHIFDRLTLHHGDMTDPGSLRRAVLRAEPDEVYNLAAQSHVGVSFQEPEWTAATIINGTLNLLEAVRELAPGARFYQASSSEMFGGGKQLNENIAFRPKSPYAIAKVAAHELCRNYREQGMWIACGILFNHESPRRGETFVTRKITRAAARIKHGLQDELVLGNLEAWRDWGFAGDYVLAMHMMLQAEEPKDYVVATGEMRQVGRFARKAFDLLGIPHELIHTDERYKRPVEVGWLQGDSGKIKAELGWQPTIDAEGLLAMMLDHDLKLAEQEAKCKLIPVSG